MKMACQKCGKKTLNAASKNVQGPDSTGPSNGAKQCSLCGGWLTASGQCNRCGGAGFPEAKVNRVPLIEALRWELVGQSVFDVVRTQGMDKISYLEMMNQWESVNDQQAFPLEIGAQQDGDDLVVVVADYRKGMCPHDKPPTTCIICIQANDARQESGDDPLWWMTSRPAGLDWQVAGIGVGDEVTMPEPGPDDLWNHGFEGRADRISGSTATVMDADDNAWDVDLTRLVEAQVVLSETQRDVSGIAEAVCAGFGDAWADGYTSEDAEETLKALNTIVDAADLPGELIMVWGENDPVYGPTGDSDLYYRQPDNTYIPAGEAYDLVDGSYPDPFVALLEKIKAGQGPASVSMTLHPVSGSRFQYV